MLHVIYFKSRNVREQDKQHLALKLTAYNAIRYVCMTGRGLPILSV